MIFYAFFSVHIVPRNAGTVAILHILRSGTVIINSGKPGHAFQICSMPRHAFIFPYFQWSSIQNMSGGALPLASKLMGHLVRLGMRD